MPVLVALIRGINVGGNRLIKMDALRKLCEALGFRDVKTHLQSGNVVFRASVRDTKAAAKRIGTEIEKTHGFCPEVVVRTVEEMGDVIARNPFSDRPDLDPSKLLVIFLGKDPVAEIRAKLAEIETAPEEVHVAGGEVFIYFPEGQGKSKFKMVPIEKLCGPAWTGRNWNTVRAVHQLASEL